ncbi:patatin-like phospholipase family protein [Vogesella oryzae]|uniref:patatin-like phospholipase family protein n=1 Tax=Vogesella oryzae TaxID=1735285 RepID=UPI0015833246|nr:patatin-like phospholipase family protein [Vogesella oryzae]
MAKLRLLLATLAAAVLAACTTPQPPTSPALPAVASAPAAASSPVASVPPPAAAPKAAPPLARPPVRAPRIALALGGGAAKGFAHVGVIRVLEQAGIRPEIIAGTSAGSVVGAIYASGISGEKLYRRALALNEDELKDFTLSANGFLKGDKLQDFVNRQVGRRPIEALPRKFAAVATNFDSGERSVFRSGNTGQAVRASAAIPNVFQPVSIKGRRYVDGGLVSPVPVVAAREMGADIVIAVDISAKPVQRKSGLFGNLDQSLTIMNQAALALELKQADVILRPRVLALGAADFDQRRLAIREGEKVGREALPVIRRIVAAWQQRAQLASR